MTGIAAPSRRPRWGVRARLTVMYAALFLAAGATLLGVTYALVDARLPRPSHSYSKPTAAEERQLTTLCKQALIEAESKSPGTKPLPHAVPAVCEKGYRVGQALATSRASRSTLDSLLWLSLIGLAGMTVLSGGLGWVMSGRVLRPVRRITEAARRASDENLHERLRLSGPHDELRELADTFDEMLDRLDAAFGSQRRFVADASHELRTPLAVMRTAIDVTLARPDVSAEQLRDLAVRVRRSIDRSEALVDALLTLASSQAGVGAVEFVDLATIAEDVLDGAREHGALGGVSLETSLDPAPSEGDRVLLERLAANLVDNAVRYNVPGGWIRVSTGSGAGEAWLCVSNSGPPVPHERVDELFEPFARLDGRSAEGGGVGLGLAIVKSVSAAHGGTVRAEARDAGGLDVSVSLGAPATR